MMPHENGTSTRRLLPATTPEFRPIKSCVRCGTSVHISASSRKKMANKRPPKWFSKSNCDVRLPPIDEQKIAAKLDQTELGQLQKVQEWLKRSHTYPQGASSRVQQHMRRPDYTLPYFRNPSLGTVNGYSVGDFHRDYSNAHQDSAVDPYHHPDPVSNESSYIAFRQRNSQYFGLHPEFTDYMTQNSVHKLRDGMGSIQRPYTPLYSLGQRQKALYGEQATYGHLNINNQTNGQQIDGQRKRTYQLQSDLQDLINR